MNAGKVSSIKRSSGLFRPASAGTTWKFIAGKEHNDFAREKINLSVNELKTERDVVKDLLPG